MRCTVSLTSLLVALAAAAGAQAGDAGLEHFEAKVRPALVAHCYECHSAQSKKLGGKLALGQSRVATQRGRLRRKYRPGQAGGKPVDRGGALQPRCGPHAPPGQTFGRRDRRVRGLGEDGGADPRDIEPAPAVGESWDDTMRARRDWWSMRPVVKPPVPEVRDAAWSAQPVDRFIRAALGERGLNPAPVAEPRTLARRLSLVLTGLPPTTEQMAEFLRDYAMSSAEGKASTAIERLVDRLLASPHFGERWARHWMDVVRFSETHGNEWNYEVHHAWRYRDYLIRAFNDDVPYDQFVREHIAGDLLPQPRWNERERFNESVIGTAFYRFGEVNHDDCISLPQIGYDLADNQIDTLTKAFQATTVACARCHDHKLDADFDGGLLRAARRPAQLPAGQPYDRRAGRERRGDCSGCAS